MTKTQSTILTAVTCAMLYVGATNEGYLAQLMLIVVGWNIHGIARYTIKGE